jgi:hypothetical protein
MDCSSIGTSFWLIVFLTFFGVLGVMLIPQSLYVPIDTLAFYLQVVIFILGSIASDFSVVDKILAFVSININSLVTDCPLPLRDVQKLLFGYFPVLMFYIWYLVIVLCVILVRRLYPKRHSSPYWIHTDKPLVLLFQAFMALLTFILMPLMDHSLKLLNCHTVNGKKLLFYEPEVECHKEPQTTGAAISVLVIIFLMGVIPFIVSCFLFYAWITGRLEYDSDSVSKVDIDSSDKGGMMFKIVETADTEKKNSNDRLVKGEKTMNGTEIIKTADMNSVEIELSKQPKTIGRSVTSKYFADY